MKLWHKGDLNDPAVPDQEGALREYLVLVTAACRRETSADPKRWMPYNRLHGHCAVVALLVQENFGGQFMRASLGKVPGYEQMRSHYWNLLPNGSEVDLTAGQFKGDDRLLVPEGSTSKGGVPITREDLLGYEPTRKRYELLKKRVNDLDNKVWRKVRAELKKRG